MATTSIHTIRSAEIKSIEYITNPDKASLITTYGCNGSACDIANAFADLRVLANDKGQVLSYHIIQSFAPNEAKAEQVHLAGKLLCDKFLQGQYKYVLATHTDTAHVHNHIIVCKTNMENLKSFGTLRDTKNVLHGEP
ncbi:MAG: relaxase/mobilization nuclease domain-containing protein [Oscillospiraceae bacterium]|nr:relaxase/mobilization nuclease domain-containing protein [Oscillospiraceae bacterium]